MDGFDVGPVYFEWTDDEVADAVAELLLVAELCMMRGEEEESESEMGKCSGCCCGESFASREISSPLKVPYLISTLRGDRTLSPPELLLSLGPDSGGNWFLLLID